MTLNSQGGVYIGGGIIPRIVKLLKASSFRDRFEGKGRVSSFIKQDLMIVGIWTRCF